MDSIDKEIDIPSLGSILITGGCGFLGSHLVSLLLANRTPQQISVFDLRTTQNRFPGVSYYEGDLTDVSVVRRMLLVAKPHVIIHTASPAAVHSFGGSSAARRRAEALMRKINVDGTRQLLELAKELGTDVFVHTSSGSVVGDQVHDMFNADERWSYVRGKAQKEYYSDTKAEAEKLVLAANSPTSPNPFVTCAVRPVTMIGERDLQATPGMLGAVHRGQTGVQIGKNENLFDFTYAGNVAWAHILAASKLVELVKELKAGRPHPSLADGAPVDFKAEVPASAENDDAADREHKTGTRVDGEAFNATNNSPLYFWDFTRAIWQGYYQASLSSPTPTREPAKITSVVVLSRQVSIVLATIMAAIYWVLRMGVPALTTRHVHYVCMTRYYSCDKARKRLGYRPLWTMDEAVERTTKWFWEHDLKKRQAEQEKKGN